MQQTQAHSRGFRHIPAGVPSGKATPPTIKFSPSREILRATEALQDDKFYTVSNFPVTRFVPQPFVEPAHGNLLSLHGF
jgi:hypothetical protein